MLQRRGDTDLSHEYSLLVCAIISSYFERLLGDLLISIKLSQKNNNNSMKQEPEEEMEAMCPRMLKDILVAPELVQFLGTDSLFLIRLLMGPPTGIIYF